MGQFWEQQPGESTAAFLAFRFYRERWVPRSPLKVYREWKKDPTIKRVPGRWQQWAREYTWAERAAAYDRYLDGIRRAATAKAVAEVHEHHAREIELSALRTLKETASLAQANIKDGLE
jgi:hypothetical protein